MQHKKVVIAESIENEKVVISEKLQKRYRFCIDTIASLSKHKVTSCNCKTHYKILYSSAISLTIVQLCHVHYMLSATVFHILQIIYHSYISMDSQKLSNDDNV